MNILVVPDCHADAHYSNERFEWLGKYIAEYLDEGDCVVQIGDFGEFRAFSHYDHGQASHVVENYEKDFEAVEDAWQKLRRPTRHKNLKWVVTEGNHEARVYKALSHDYRLKGSIDPDKRFPWRREKDVEWARYGIPIRVAGVSFIHALLLSTGRPQSSRSGPARAALIEYMDSVVVGHSHLWDYWQSTQARRDRRFAMHCGHYSHPKHAEESWCEATSPAWWSGVTVLHGVKKGYPYEGMTMEPYSNLEKWYK